MIILNAINLNDIYFTGTLPGVGILNITFTDNMMVLSWNAPFSIPDRRFSVVYNISILTQYDTTNNTNYSKEFNHLGRILCNDIDITITPWNPAGYGNATSINISIEGEIIWLSFMLYYLATCNIFY